MPDKTNQPTQVNPGAGAVDGSDSSTVGGTVSKEKESLKNEDDQIVAEIKDRSTELDRQAERQIQAEISGARLARPEPEIPADVSEHGVSSPELEAGEILKKGTTLQLPITEKEYEEALHKKVTGIVINKVVVGVSGLFALAVWAGRMMKLVHKRLRIVFKKGD